MQSPAPSNSDEVDALTLRHMLEQGRAILIDVREREEFEEERIPGAILIPLSAFDPAHVAGTAPDRLIVLHCLSGSRAQKAAAALAVHGSRKALTLKDGLLGWKNAGLRTETAGPENGGAS